MSSPENEHYEDAKTNVGCAIGLYGHLKCDAEYRLAWQQAGEQLKGGPGLLKETPVGKLSEDSFLVLVIYAVAFMQMMEDDSFSDLMRAYWAGEGQCRIIRKEKTVADEDGD